MKKSPTVLFLAMIFSLIFFGLFFWWGYNLMPVDPQDSQPVSFAIDKGEGLIKISEELQKQGLIKNSFHFKIYSFLLGISKDIQAGSYRLNPSMSPKEIAKTLTKGTNDQWIVVFEGLRAEQIGQLFYEKGYLIDFTKWKEQVASENIEGKLFPDSYLIPQGADQEKIIQILLKNFDKKVVNSFESEFTKSNLSQNEVLILASLVEREARHDNDRAIVAGILLNRYYNSWPLQIDASVQYAISSIKCHSFVGCNWWPDSLTQSDLQADSLYNTYLYKGLPPKPICNPGISSIKAVLQSQKTNYWFYLSDKKGNIHYAETSEEHAANIQKYLK